MPILVQIFFRNTNYTVEFIMLTANVLLAWEVAEASELRCIGEDKNYS